MSLVELLVALVLGLVVAGGAAALYLSNRQTYTVIEGMSRLAENERVAVEMLSREIRDAGSTACVGAQMATVPGGNFVPSSSYSTNYWAQWSTGLLGDAFGKGPPTTPISNPPSATAQVAGTSSLLIWSSDRANGTKPVKISNHDVALDQFTVPTNKAIGPGDVFTACDGQTVVTLQENGSTMSTAIKYSTSAGIPTVNSGGFLSPLVAHLWYIGKTTKTQPSDPTTTALRRMKVLKDGTYWVNDEMVRDVTDMQISYLVGDLSNIAGVVPNATQYVSAAAVANWADVIAVRVTLTFATLSAVGNTGGANVKITHPITFTVALRNRLGVGS